MALDPAMAWAIARLEREGGTIPSSAAEATREALLEAGEVGAWYRVLGHLDRSDLPVGAEAVGGWHGLLVHGGPSYTYVVCPSPPDSVRSGENYVVTGQLSGTHSFVTPSGEPRQAPLLVVRRWELFDVDATSPQDGDASPDEDASGDTIFEETFEGPEVPVEWRFDQPFGVGRPRSCSLVEIDATVGAGTPQSLHFLGDASTNIWRSLNRDVEVKGGERYTLRGRIKADLMRGEESERKGVWALSMRFHDRDGVPLDGAATKLDPGTYDWRDIEVTHTAPLGACQLTVGVLLGEPGELWVDDLVLTREG